MVLFTDIKDSRLEKEADVVFPRKSLLFPCYHSAYDKKFFLYFLVDSGIQNWNLSTLAPGEFSLSTFLCIESTIWRPKSVPIKRAAKTIKLHSCDVENCEDTSATIETGALNDVSYKNNTHILSISIRHFPKDEKHDQSGRVSIAVIEDILFFNVINLMLRTGFEDGCYEHIRLVKLGEDNQ